MVDIEEQKILERADKITERLFKALYSEEEGDTIDYPTFVPWGSSLQLFCLLSKNKEKYLMSKRILLKL
jgi:hypothetical protein